jgi:molybdopterin synthase sulfur carrier subunit
LKTVSSQNSDRKAIEITVKFYGVFRKASGKQKVNYRTTEIKTLTQVLEDLTSELPKEFRATLIDPVLGDPTPNALIMINGKEISALNGMETRLKDRDEITVIPVSHGGNSTLNKSEILR